jgi:hypothetical protein
LGEPLVLGKDVARRVDSIVDHLLDTRFIDADGGMLQIGPVAEKRYGKRHYLDLTAVFADLRRSLSCMVGHRWDRSTSEACSAALTTNRLWSSSAAATGTFSTSTGAAVLWRSSRRNSIEGGPNG